MFRPHPLQEEADFNKTKIIIYHYSSSICKEKSAIRQTDRAYNLIFYHNNCLGCQAEFALQRQHDFFLLSHPTEIDDGISHAAQSGIDAHAGQFCDLLK